MVCGAIRGPMCPVPSGFPAKPGVPTDRPSRTEHEGKTAE
jgi:hypothetical protein